MEEVSPEPLSYHLRRKLKLSKDDNIDYPLNTYKVLRFFMPEAKRHQKIIV